jgi:hypothetical protein
MLTFNTGASAVLLPTHNKLVVYNDSSQRIIALDLATRLWETVSNHPYIAGTAIEGKRLEFVKSEDGVLWLYLLRPGGQEFWRLPLEWLP